MLEIGFGDGVQGGFLHLVSSSLFLLMGLQSQISISMLEAKALGQWWKAAWFSRFGITAPFPAALVRSTARGFSLLGMHPSCSYPSSLSEGRWAVSPGKGN